MNIPSSEVFFVAGEVHAPGSFPLKENTNLRQAITLAQGTTPNAALGRGIIVREDPISGKRQEINVDIGDVMKGKKGDLAIMPNDTVIVPNSRLKTVGNTFLNCVRIWHGAWRHGFATNAHEIKQEKYKCPTRSLTLNKSVPRMS